VEPKAGLERSGAPGRARVKRPGGLAQRTSEADATCPRRRAVKAAGGHAAEVDGRTRKSLRDRPVEG
jgi:hypothetical protein